MPAGKKRSLQSPQTLFSRAQLVRISDTLEAADAETGFTFSVYVGDLNEPTAEHVAKLHAELEDPADSVLLAISPNQRVLEIVTGRNVKRQISDQSSALVSLSMAAALGGGDLTGAIVIGLRMLTDRAR